MSFDLRRLLGLAVLGKLSMLTLQAGTVAEASRGITLTSREGQRQELVYYVWDLGDGRLLPTARGFAEAPAGITAHWPSAGTYQVGWQAVGLSGWSREGDSRQVVVDESSIVEPGKMLEIASVRVAEGMGKGEPHEASYRFFTQTADTVSSLAVELTTLAPVNWLVLSSSGEFPFPQSFQIQTSLADDGPWYPLPSANFPFFPEPEGKSVWIPLNGLVAKAIRVVVTGMHPWRGGYAWYLPEVEVIGAEAAGFAVDSKEAKDSAVINNLWLTFGTADNEVHQRFDPWWETDRPLDGGMVCIGSCEWLAWGALKLSWLGPHPQADRLESYIANNPVDSDGMVWAAPNSPKHLGHSIHFVNNAIYPMAVAHHYLMQRDPQFLEKTDDRTGETVLVKARRAMEYQLNELGGSSGLVTYSGPEHDGTPNSHGTNYWDFWLFGHESAYGNAFFYESLRLMAELEEALGNEERAAELRELRPLVRKAYNDAFWNEATGRYLGWIDVNGVPYDYGFTFVNAMALALGLADPDQAASVLAWLEGERMVAGDDSQGEDIYAFGFGPRTNTLDARHGSPPPVNTWGGALNIQPGGSAAYGEQIQNGGAIFYVSYYDLHARQNYGGDASFAERWTAIRDGFIKDQLRRDPANNRGASDIVGILREFPESGLVPYYLVDGVVGIEPLAAGLKIAPALPGDWDSATINAFWFAGRPYRVVVKREATSATIGRVADETVITVPADGAWLLKTDGTFAEFDLEGGES